MAALPTPHDNSEYPYEPAHSRSLIWISLSVEKKNAPKRESCPFATWEQWIPNWACGISADWSWIRGLLKKSAPKHDSCTYATREQRLSIWACASAQPDLDFAVWWKKKCTAAWELPLRSIGTANTHEPAHWKKITAVWALSLRHHENSEYPYEPAHPRSLICTLDISQQYLFNSQ